MYSELGFDLQLSSIVFSNLVNWSLYDFSYRLLSYHVTNKKNLVFNVDPVTSATSDDEENEFYDAQEDGASIASQGDSSFILKIPRSTKRNSNDATGSSSEGEEPKSETQQVAIPF